MEKPEFEICKICSKETSYLFQTILLHKYKVKYYKCSNCGFIQTEKPYWLSEAYSDAITELDIGLISRNIEFTKTITPILYKYFGKDKKYLDYGGGYGMFVRMMRDNGLRFYRQDIYCDNLFAKHFDIRDIDKKTVFELVTAFEVFEHLVDPLDEIEKMFEFAPSILFSTLIQPDIEIKHVDDWWYFIPETGQHVALFTLKSLQKIAEKYGKRFYTNGSTLHMFTDKKLPKNVLHSNLINKISYFLYKKSVYGLLKDDFDKIKNSNNSK